MSTLLTKKKFSVPDFHLMVESGILTENDRVELLDGEIIKKTPIGNRHIKCVIRLTKLLSRKFKMIVL